MKYTTISQAALVLALFSSSLAVPIPKDGGQGQDQLLNGPVARNNGIAEANVHKAPQISSVETTSPIGESGFDQPGTEGVLARPRIGTVVNPHLSKVAEENKAATRRDVSSGDRHETPGLRRSDQQVDPDDSRQQQAVSSSSSSPSSPSSTAATTATTAETPKTTQSEIGAPKKWLGGGIGPVILPKETFGTPKYPEGDEPLLKSPNGSSPQNFRIGTVLPPKAANKN